MPPNPLESKATYFVPSRLIFWVELLYDFAVFFLQQEQVLSELVWYINQDPPPPNKDAAAEVLAYLEACSLLFEKGF